MNMPHTPGPWSIWDFADDPRHIYVGPQAGGIAVADIVACNAHGGFTAASEAQGQANARLIANAPALLAALQALVGEADLGEIDHDDNTRALLAQARAAISRAIGGQ